MKMFSIYCCCCFKPTENLLSVQAKSPHEDGKTLLDYLNSVFGAFLKEYKASNLICVRCSKALQVAYHFINMVNKSKEFKRSAPINNKEESLDILTLPQMRHKAQDKQSNPALDECHIKNELKFKTNSEMSLQNVDRFHITNNLKVTSLDCNQDVDSSPVNTKCNLEFTCNICNTRFDDKTRFVDHNRQKHKEIIPYKCKLCSFYTCYSESLFKHCVKVHGLSKVTLDFYQRKEVPKRADDSPEFEITYSCLPCSYEESNQSVMEEHLLNEHSVDEDTESFVKKLFSCPACCRSFMSLKSAKIHYSMYHICSFKTNNLCKKRKFCCEKCGKFFDLKSGLLMHRSVCVKREIVNCNFCNREFTSVLKYERHLQDTHFVAIKHACETCSKIFNCSEYLAVHRKRHNERNFQCDLCPKNYISNAELKVHKQRIHAIKHAAIACGVCKKKFANLTHLKYHENNTHKAPFLRCDFCDFVSSSRSALVIHQLNHTNKQYKCHL